MTPRFKYRTQYDLDSEQLAGDAAATVFEDASLTNQSFTADVDLNVMVRRFGIGDGAIPPALVSDQIVDLSEAPLDLKDAFDRVQTATTLFGQLPAALRGRFNNDPASLLTFVSDPRNAEEAVTLGLLQKTAGSGSGAASNTGAAPQTPTP